MVKFPVPQKCRTNANKNVVHNATSGNYFKIYCDDECDDECCNLKIIRI